MTENDPLPKLRMHKSYQSVKPCSNKLLQKRWDDTYHKEHRRKVAQAVPIVDTRAPRTYLHLHFKLKKLQMEEEKLALIERDNRMLLERMSTVMRTHGRIDNQNNVVYKSLAREKKERELARITRENREILGRILSKKPEYSVKKWRDDWQQNLQYMDSISQWPINWWQRKPALQSSHQSKRLPAMDRSQTSLQTKSELSMIEQRSKTTLDKPKPIDEAAADN